jgi:hypothetical protein
LQGEAGAAQFALHQRQRHMIQSAAAQLLRHVRRIESGLQRLGLDLLDQLRPHLSALHLILMGRELASTKARTLSTRSCCSVVRPNCMGRLRGGSRPGKSRDLRYFTLAGSGMDRTKPDMAPKHCCLDRELR